MTVESRMIAIAELERDAEEALHDWVEQRASTQGAALRAIFTTRAQALANALASLPRVSRFGCSCPRDVKAYDVGFNREKI